MRCIRSKESRFQELGNTALSSADDLMAIMGLIPGAVTPLGLLNDGEKKVTLYLDAVFSDDHDLKLIEKETGRSIYLGGYSLAGLFALWAGYQTDVFDGIAAASPSIWFPHFITYMLFDHGTH